MAYKYKFNKRWMNKLRTYRTLKPLLCLNLIFNVIICQGREKSALDYLRCGGCVSRLKWTGLKVYLQTNVIAFIVLHV